MSTDTEQVTISQAAYDHLRVQISMLKDDLHHALEENNKLKAAAKAVLTAMAQPADWRTELETIAEILEADGDEWNCAARIRKMLAAAPSPEGQEAEPERLRLIPLTERMPDPDKHPRVVVYTEGSDFQGEQFFDVDAESLNENRYADPADQPEVCRYATHWIGANDLACLAKAIASNPDTCPVWPWWLKGSVTAEEVRQLTLRFARALLERATGLPHS